MPTFFKNLKIYGFYFFQTKIQQVIEISDIKVIKRMADFIVIFCTSWFLTCEFPDYASVKVKQTKYNKKIINGGISLCSMQYSFYKYSIRNNESVLYICLYCASLI